MILIDIRKLRYFITVAEELNFTRAAEKHYVAQPAISQQIASLERSLGVKLFNRNKQSVELTNAGIVFLQDSKEIVEKYMEAIKRAQEAEVGIVGNLNIGLLSVHVKQLLPVVVRMFKEKYPEVNINFFYYNTEKIIQTIKNDGVDIGFTLSYGLKNTSSIVYEKLWTQRMCVVVPKDHVFANKRSISLRELANESFVTLDYKESPHGYEHLISLCATHDFSPKIVSTALRMDAVLMMVDAGIGITIASTHLQTTASTHLKFIDIIDETIEIDVVVAWKKTSHNPSLSLFIEDIHTALKSITNDKP